MLNFTIRPLLLKILVAIGFFVVSPVSHAADHPLTQEQSTALGVYIKGQKTEILQKAQEEFDRITFREKGKYTIQSLFPVSWMPEHHYPESPLKTVISTAIQGSVEKFCSDKKIGDGELIAGNFLATYKQAFEKFDETYNKIRQEMIKHKGELEGQVLNNQTTAAFGNILKRIAEELHKELQGNLDAIEALKHVPFEPEKK